MDNNQLYTVTESQKKYLAWDLGIFFHYGIRTFNHNHHDWDGVPMDASTFNPTDFDPDSWIKIIKKAGASFAVMTTKHHDAFCMWPSAYSSYTVADSSWKDGKGDAVAMFTEACHKNGMPCGLYYSPNEWGNRVDFSDKKATDMYYYGQMKELLDGRYGKIDYLWFDGSFPKGYDASGVYAYIKELQPEILVTKVDVAGVGNEDAYVPYDMTNDEKGKFVCREADLRMRDSWFWENNEYTLKPVNELLGMVESGIGRGASILLNLGPNPTGHLEETDVKRLRELKKAVEQKYSKNCGFDSLVKDGNSYILSYSEEKYKTQIKDTMFIPRVTRLVIKENLAGGSMIKGWKLYATIPSKYPYFSEWSPLLCEGHGIGRTRIISVPSMRCPRFRLEITDAVGEPEITDFEAYSG